MFLNKNKSVFLSFIAVLFFSGCATVPMSLSPETASGIKKIALVTNQKTKEIEVLDHTEITEKHSTVVGSQLGLVGVLVESGIRAGVASSKKSKSLGGDPDILKQELGEYPVKEILDDHIINRLQKNYALVNQEIIESEMTWVTDDHIYNEKGYIDASNKLGADALIRIDFKYGLAAYADEHASAVIDADYSVHDVVNNKVLLKRNISSDSYHKKGHVVDEFAANDGELFKNDINEAAKGLSLLIASYFGIDKEEMINANIVEKMPMRFVTCKNPYILEQDCSGWSLAGRTVEINGTKINIGGSSDGKIVVIKENNTFLHTFADELTLGISNTHTKANQSCLDIIKAKLMTNDINIIKTTKLVDDGKIDGYILELDSNGYSLLKESTVLKEKTVQENDCITNECS